MQKLAEICVKRPVFTVVLVLLMAVFGFFAYNSLGVDRFPKVDFPVITVTTVLAGASPEEVETEITDKVEEAVNTVSGIDELRSSSFEGMSQVYVSFVLEKNVDIASQEVRDKVQGILADLPKGIEQPRVEKFGTDVEPVMTIALSGNFPIRDITEYGDKVLRRGLEPVSGVGQVRLIGGQKRRINVELDPSKLRSYGLTVADVARALRAQNLQVPGGTLKQGEREFTLRTLGRVESLNDLGLISVSNKGGHIITVNDVGNVVDGTEEAVSMAQVNDTPAVLLQILKQSGTNTVQVVHNLKERLEELKPTFPQGYTVRIVRDQSVYIEDATATVKEHLVLGAILAALVIFFFLANWRTTLIAGLAIPTSIIATFAVMKMFGFTMNMITLLALTLCVGIVIDDAIVVLENIFRYIEEKNYKPFDAALAATKEIGLAVLAITLSLVAVFLPIAVMSGIVGRFMSSFGVTMSAAILLSMLISFTLTPMLASRWLKRPFAKNGNDNGNGNGDQPLEEHSMQDFENEHAHSASKGRGFYHWIEVVYLALLRFSLKYRFVVVLLAIAAILSMGFTFPRVRKNFLPEDDESQFQLNVRAPEGTSLEATQLVLQRIARDLRKMNGVEFTITSAGDDQQQQMPNVGSIFVSLMDVRKRAFTQFQAMDFVRKEILPKYAPEKLRISVTQVAAFSGGGMANAAIQYLVAGPDMNKLADYSGQLADKLRQIPGAVDVDSSLVIGKPEYGIRMDRAKAADLGVSVEDLAMTLRLLVAGDKVSDYAQKSFGKSELYDVYVRAQSNRRTFVDQLMTVPVPSSKLGTVALADLVHVDEGLGPSKIDRLNRRRQVSVTANLAPGASQQAIMDALDKAVKELHMDPEYSTALTGQSKEMAKLGKAFMVTLILALVFVYLVIAAQFESWIHPVTILLALPLTLPFALFSLLLAGESLNIFSMLGVMVLFAVVKKNSILQINHTIQLREQGLSRYDAIIAANLDRLRPILMTTVAFVAGMIPLLLSNGTGAATNRTISSLVIGGQTMSLLLTLLATPVAYSLFDDAGRLPARIRNLFRRKVRQESDEKAILPPALIPSEAEE